MGKVGLKPKKYSCFTPEQQEYYEKMSLKQRRYIDFRGQGYNKTQSYKMAGYSGKVAGQAAYLLEERNRDMKELIDLIQANKRARELTEQESSINQQIDALAQQEYAEKTLEKIEGADGELARRIQFYRDIVNGKIKTVRKTIKKNPEGEILETKIEEVSDIETRMKARRELDRILGLNTIPDLGNINMGDITINIVDASKKDELADERNKVVLDAEEVIIDGEKVAVVDEKVEQAKGNETQSKSERFFDVMGETDGGE